MSTTTTTKTVTCKRCGALGLYWRKSKAGKFYLAEYVMVNGRYRWFSQYRLHRCSTQVHTEPTPLTVYGLPLGPVEDPATHEHRWLPWRNAPGGVTGAWCFGCRGRIVD